MSATYFRKVSATTKLSVVLKGATRKVLTRKVLMRKVLNLKIGLRVVLTALCRQRAYRI